MEKKDTNTDYQKFVKQKWVLEICIHYFLYREFSSPTWKKSLPPKVPIPTQNPDST